MDTVISVKNLGIYFNPPQDSWRVYFELLFGWNFKKRRDEGLTVLKDISFEVKRGEIVGIIGVNGAGKSTLLRILSGLSSPTVGSYFIEGRVASVLELGSVFNPEWSGLENLQMAAAAYGVVKSKLAEKIELMSKFSELEPRYLEMPVKNYSSGMVMRLAFSAIANVDADVLIIDEALSVGDVFFRQKCLTFIHEFSKNGTILFATHSMSSAQSLSDRVIWLDNGVVKKIGAPKQVSEHYLNHSFAIKNRLRSTEASSTINGRYQVINNTLDELVAVRLVELIEVETGAAINLVKSGMRVRLNAHFHTSRKIENLIAGFFWVNRDGLNLFGENTFEMFKESPIRVDEDKLFRVSFEFVVPRMQIGDYVISVACASGTQRTHTMLLWEHNALKVSFTENWPSVGMIGIDVLNMEIIQH